MRGEPVGTMEPAIKKLLLGLFGLTLLVRALTAATLDHAGYLDAFYYYHLALNMVSGQGITETVIWNYLDDPQMLPRPGNQYWMPMTNFLAWLGMAALGPVLPLWRAAQLPFVLLSSLLPPLAAWLSWHEWRRRDWAIGAGLLTLFSGYTFTYWVVTDNFTPFALAVALALLAAWKGQEEPRGHWWVLAGVGVGLSHLTRVDGVLLVPVVAILLAWRFLRGPERSVASFVQFGVLAAVGYLLVMAPWWARNWAVTGTPFPGGGTQTLWLRSYDEIFSYEPELTLERYLAWGWGPILGSKVNAVVWSALIVLGSTQFFLAPFILGMVRDAARRPLFRPFLLYTAMLLTAMPLVFTFPAVRGSLLHSSAALIPWMMALAPAGIERAIQGIARRRRAWNAAQASRIFGVGFVGVAAVVTLYLHAGAVWLEPGPNALLPRWNERTLFYEEVEDWLARAGAFHDERIFVGNAPNYYVTTGRHALTIPTDGPETLARAAREWDAYWLLLDRENRGAYMRMYDERTPEAGWEPVATFTDALGHPVYLFRLEP